MFAQVKQSFLFGDNFIAFAFKPVAKLSCHEDTLIHSMVPRSPTKTQCPNLLSYKTRSCNDRPVHSKHSQFAFHCSFMTASWFGFYFSEHAISKTYSPSHGFLKLTQARCCALILMSHYWLIRIVNCPVALTDLSNIYVQHPFKTFNHPFGIVSCSGLAV